MPLPAIGAWMSSVVFQPAQYEVGRRWQINALGILTSIGVPLYVNIQARVRVAFAVEICSDSSEPG